MRFGCCLNMAAREKDGIGSEYLRALAELGYDYAELPLAEIMELDDGQKDRILQRLNESGLRCEVCNNLFPKYMRLTGPNPDGEGYLLDYVQRAFAQAAKMGATKVVFGSGAAKRLPDRFPRERGYEQLVTLCRKIGPIAGAYGITVNIEPLRKKECNIINTFQEGCQLAKDAVDKNIGVILDFYHFSQSDEPISQVEKLAVSYLKHIHLSCPSGRVFPGFQNEFVFRDFFSMVMRIGYKNTLSIEAYTDDFERDAKESLDVLRSNLATNGR